MFLPTCLLVAEVWGVLFNYTDREEQTDEHLAEYDQDRRQL